MRIEVRDYEFNRTQYFVAVVDGVVAAATTSLEKALAIAEAIATKKPVDAKSLATPFDRLVSHDGWKAWNVIADQCAIVLLTTVGDLHDTAYEAEDKMLCELQDLEPGARLQRRVFD
ncbi:hypothetical protein ACJ41P_24475 [Azospirillum argentinense]|uniref:DUF1902 domain-containing protein n=1 Tax=Azospirillum argentinense TaxID=2970906 RepID=A0ABW8VG85_9PROT